MSKLVTLGFRTRIALPFVITAAALVFIGLFSINAVRNLVSDVDEVADSYLPAVSEILNGDRDLYQALTAQLGYVDAAFNLEDNASNLKDFNENVEQAKERFGLAVNRLKGTGVEKHSRGFDQAFTQWLASAQKVMALADEGQLDAARNLNISETAPLFKQLRDFYNEISEHADEQANL